MACALLFLLNNVTKFPECCLTLLEVVAPIRHPPPLRGGGGGGG